jgi:hypothetical protein
MAAAPVAAVAQPIPDWSIQQDCPGDKQCTDGEVGARNFLTDNTWQPATPRRRADCLAWEAQFHNRYWPELSAGERYMNLFSCVDGKIIPRTFQWR